MHYVSKVNLLNLNIYFDCQACPSSVRVCVSLCVTKFFSLKSPWDHPPTHGVDPLTPTPRPPGHAAPPEELARARRALSSNQKSRKVNTDFQDFHQYYSFSNPHAYSFCAQIYHSHGTNECVTFLKADTTLLVRMDITLQNIKRLFLPFLSKMLICKPVLYEKRRIREGNTYF